MLLLIAAQEVDHLRLRNHVQHAGRLVEQDHLRLEHGDTCQRSTLQFAAGKFAGIAGKMLGV